MRTWAMRTCASEIRADIQQGKAFLPRCQDMPDDAFLEPAVAEKLIDKGPARGYYKNPCLVVLELHLAYSMVT